MKSTLAAITAFLALSGSLAHAGLVYDNGPINGSVDAWEIDGTNYVSDSFTVTQSTTLAWAEAGIWTFPQSAPPLTIDWSIGTSADGSDISSGTSLVSNDFTGDYGFGFAPIYESGFALSGTLTAGVTYYLTLTNATSEGPSYWDENDGPSVAEANGSSVGSESFQLYNSIPAVPDQASTLLLLAVGALALAGARRLTPA